MTGPEHYREAERLTALVIHEESGNVYDHTGSDSSVGPKAEEDMRVINLAQVHATLALVAATAGPLQPWDEVLS